MASKKVSAPNVATAVDPDCYWKTKLELDKKSIKLFDQIVFRDWCKACGICIAFCPKKVFSRDKAGKLIIERPDDCNGCLFCELHCPDFAITIKERFVDRRKHTNEDNTADRKKISAGK